MHNNESLNNNTETKTISEAEEVLGSMPSFADFERNRNRQKTLDNLFSVCPVFTYGDNQDREKAFDIIKETLLTNDGKTFSENLTNKLKGNMFDSRGQATDYGINLYNNVASAVIEFNAAHIAEKEKDRETGLAKGATCLMKMRMSLTEPEERPNYLESIKAAERITNYYEEQRLKGEGMINFRDFVRFNLNEYHQLAHREQEARRPIMDGRQRSDFAAFQNLNGCLDEIEDFMSFMKQNGRALPADETLIIDESDFRPERFQNIDQIREKRFLSILGKYEPTSEEIGMMIEDRDFWGSKWYERRLQKEAEMNPDIYNPTNESVIQTIRPFYEATLQKSDELYELGFKIEEGEITVANVADLVDFFAEIYGIRDLPEVRLIYERESLGGYYNDGKNLIAININNKKGTTAGLINTIAHETWHVYQHRNKGNNERYRINNALYCKSSISYEMYRNQLIEKEAFILGDNIGDIYRKMDLERHPEKLPDLIKKYEDYNNKKYNPWDHEDGVDFEYLRCIHNYLTNGYY